VRAAWGDFFYVAGPVLDSHGKLAGVLLVGMSLPTIVRDIRSATLAQVSLYDPQGQLLASTLPPTKLNLSLTSDVASQVAARQANDTLVRNFAVASAGYSEIVGPWRARDNEPLGLIGSALTRNYFALPTSLTSLQAFILVASAFVVIIALGTVLTGRITRPLTEMVRVSTQVAQGNLEVKVNTSGNDEVAVLAHAFNYMVAGLQEGNIYRDLLGRTVSPEVREQLRQGFASGDLRLEGQNVTATVMMSDIRGFTTLSENEQPTTVLAWLNEYFGGLVPIISRHGGVVDKFEGDAILAFFGILPLPLSPKESAYQACLAAVAMLKRIDRLNDQRATNGLPPFVTGIGLNTGLVTAGGLGTADRLNYTVIGDAVNIAQRLESFTRDFGVSAIVLSVNTAAALEEHCAEFHLELLGTQSLRGKREEVTIYRLHGLADSLPVTEK
jgi:adenylate cyclase